MSKYGSREKRVERLEILSLTRSEAARFSEAWGSLQNRFVDNPKPAVSHLSNRSTAYAIRLAAL